MGHKGSLAGEFEIKVKLRTLGGLGEIKMEIESDGGKESAVTGTLSRYDAEHDFEMIVSDLLHAFKAFRELYK